MKGISFYFAKRGSDGITSSFVATRKNPLPSYILIHAEEATESTVTVYFFLYLKPTPAGGIGLEHLLIDALDFTMLWNHCCLGLDGCRGLPSKKMAFWWPCHGGPPRPLCCFPNGVRRKKPQVKDGGIKDVWLLPKTNLQTHFFKMQNSEMH